MQVHHGVPDADPDVASAVDGQRVRSGAGRNLENRPPAGAVLDAEVTPAPIGRVVRNEPPVVLRETRRRRRVVEVEAEVVLLHANRIESEVFAVYAVEPNAHAPIDDAVIEDDMVGVNGKRRQERHCEEEETLWFHDVLWLLTAAAADSLFVPSPLAGFTLIGASPLWFAMIFCLSIVDYRPYPISMSG